VRKKVYSTSQYKFIQESLLCTLWTKDIHFQIVLFVYSYLRIYRWFTAGEREHVLCKDEKLKLEWRLCCSDILKCTLYIHEASLCKQPSICAVDRWNGHNFLVVHNRCSGALHTQLLNFSGKSAQICWSCWVECYSAVLLPHVLPFINDIHQVDKCYLDSSGDSSSTGDRVSFCQEIFDVIIFQKNGPTTRLSIVTDKITR